MKYTNTDLYNGFVFLAGNNKYIISDINLDADKCTITKTNDKSDVNRNYPIYIILDELNIKRWKQVETTYEIY